MGKYNTGNAISGAMTGASIGSAGGPWGTLAGGIVGGALGLFGSKKKKKKKAKPISTLDPQQQQLYGDYNAGVYGEGPFADLYNYDAEAANANFENMYSKPAYRQFQENVVPIITGQFRGANIMNSSYTGEALSRAGRDVQENLNAQRANMVYQGTQAALDRKQGAIDKILSMQTFAMNKPTARTPGTIDQILSTLGPAAGEWFADYLKSGKGGATASPSSPALPVAA
jgi:hypothetical protein